MTRRIDQIDLRLLRVFMSVVEHGGFVQGQVELNINQSTLSSHMAELEGRLGMRLCERGRSGFKLNPDGKMVYEAAKRLFNNIDEFNSEVRSKAGRLVGELEIVCTDHLITHEDFKFSAALARFKQRNEAVRINIHVRSPAEMLHGVVEDLFHLGIGSHLKNSTQVEYFTLCHHQHHLYCSKDHPLFGQLAKAKTLKASDLKRWEIVKPKFRQAEMLPKSLRALPTMTATGFNIESVAMFVLSGRYLGFLPSHYAQRWVERGVMRALNPDSLSATLEIGVVLKKKRTRKPIVQAFVDDLLAVHHEAKFS